MAIFSNTFLTYDAKGLRENLTDAIFDISPEDTPFISSIGRAKASAVLHEWQTDVLATAISTNAVFEGDDVTTIDATTATSRIGNYNQISRKTLVVSDTEEAVNKAGRKSELAYQLAKRGKELKRDFEKTVLDNQGAVAGAAGTARKTGSFLAFIRTNVDKDATGGNPVAYTIPVNPRTDGTPRAFTETILKNTIQLMWTNGASLEYLMLGAGNKVTASGFAGIATKTYYQSAPRPISILGAADVYVSDFGKLSIIANRFQRNRDGILFDPEYASLFFLRPMTTTKLARTGDAEKRMLIAEWGLKIHNELAHGLCADLT